MNSGAAGDGVASSEFDSWARAHWSQLLGLARVVSGDPALADDVLQDCLIDLHRRWERINREGSSPLAYAARVMGSKASNYRRASWARRVFLTAEPASMDLAVGDTSGEVDARLAVSDALRQLNRRQRQIVAMHYLLDMPVAEIAGELQRPISSITSDLTRARQRLRRALMQGGDDAHE